MPAYTMAVGHSRAKADAGCHVERWDRDVGDELSIRMFEANEAG